MKMSDEDFWGQSVKRTENREAMTIESKMERIKSSGSTNRREPPLNGEFEISNEDLTNVDQLEANRELLLLSASRTAAARRNESPRGAADRLDDRNGRKTSDISNVQSEHRHTRSPSYTSSSDEGSAGGSPKSRRRGGNDEQNDEYSDRFDSSGAESRISDNEEEENRKGLITNRAKPMVGNGRGETEGASSNPNRKNSKRPKPVATARRALPKSTKPPPPLPPPNANKSRPFNLSTSTNPTIGPPPRRLRSARTLRDELEYLKKQLSESRNENRTLRQLQRRQEAALARLDGRRAEMPTLLERQAEEVRVVKEQLRMQKEKQRELERVLRERDDRLLHALDKSKRLEKTLKDKGIEPRGVPQGTNAETVGLRQQLGEKEKKIRDLERQVSLLTKNHKHQLSIEVMRHKETQRKLRELEDDYKNRQLRKAKGYSTTRTARQSSNEKANRHQDSLAHSFNAGQGSSTLAKIRSILSHEDEDDDIVAQADNVLASLKPSPPKPTQPKPPTDAPVSKPRRTRSITKKPVPKDEDGDQCDPESPIATADSLENMIQSSTLLDDLLVRKETQGPPAPPQLRPPQPPPLAATSAPSPPLRSTSIFDHSTSVALESKPSILDEIMQKPAEPPAPVAEDRRESPIPPQANAEFLDDLFGPKPSAQQRPSKRDSLDKASKSSDSGIDHSLDSTPKQIPSAPKTRAAAKTGTLDLDSELFPPKKPGSDALFPWETNNDQAKSGGTNRQPSKSSTKPMPVADDLFSTFPNLGAVN